MRNKLRTFQAWAIRALLTVLGAIEQAPSPPEQPKQIAAPAMSIGEQPSLRAMWRVLRHDAGFIIAATLSAAMLLVSVYATYFVVRPFHDTALLSLATLAAYELGAVGCKVATLWMSEWAWLLNPLTLVLLAIAGFANYVHGLDLFVAAPLGPTLAGLRAAGWGGVATVIFAVVVQALLFIFLTLATSRARLLTLDLDRLEAARKVKELRAAFQVYRLVREEMAQFGMHEVLQLPSSGAALLTEGEQTALTCIKCGAAVADMAARRASGRYGCEQCKSRP